ncbi:MAG: hypothetical protein JO023_19565 [Chloroflexi bacterium]|nr:hypothetical protein [Chloroflexota bacterium]
MDTGIGAETVLELFQEPQDAFAHTLHREVSICEETSHSLDEVRLALSLDASLFGRAHATLSRKPRTA